MKTKFALLTIAVSSLIFIMTACTSQEKKNVTTEQTTSGKAVYTCEMHPEVTSDKPGKCPKCDMDLIKSEVKKNDTAK